MKALGVQFERMKPFRVQRLCEKCGQTGAAARHFRLDFSKGAGDEMRTLTSRIHDIDPLGYLELSSNQVKSVILRECRVCGFQWLELAIDEWSKWSGMTKEAHETQERLLELTTLINWKLEAKDSTEMDLAESLKQILDVHNDIILALPRNSSPDALQERAAELAACCFEYVTQYRKAHALQGV